MKIYVNEFHEIKALRENDTGDSGLREYEVDDDFLSNYCDTLIKSFCYHIVEGENGVEFLSIYPYKDFSLLESIQEQNDIREQQLDETVRNAVNMDFRLTMLEMI